MKKLASLIMASLFYAIISNCQTIQKDFPVLNGPYLGQKHPTDIPKVFAPGIVSRDGYFEHSAAVFSPNGKEVYWSSKPNGARYFEIYLMKMINGQWTEPKIAFSRDGCNFNYPVFSTDGNKLFFNIDGDIWFVKRQDDGWSKEERISSKINSSSSEKIGSITSNNSIYFIRVPEFEVYVSRNVNDNYIEPVKLEKTVNFDNARKMSVYVAPDNSYLILEASKGQATSEFFVNYKMKNGSWSECKKLPIDWGRFPCVSPDGQYLFFMTRDGIYWVSAKIIEDLKLEEFK